MATYIKSCDSCAADDPCGTPRPNVVSIHFDYYDLDLLTVETTFLGLSSSTHGYPFYIGEDWLPVYNYNTYTYFWTSNTGGGFYEPTYYTGSGASVKVEDAFSDGLWTSSVNIYVRAAGGGTLANVRIYGSPEWYGSEEVRGELIFNGLTIGGEIDMANYQHADAPSFGVITVYRTRQANGKFFTFQFA